MNISRLKHPLAAVLTVIGLAGASISPALTQSASAAVTSGSPAVQAQPSFSPGVQDILKMLDAKVDLDVIKAYIASKSIVFNPTATEIIALKQRGVPNDVLTALMQRGAEVREQLARAAGHTGMASVAPATPEPIYGNDYGVTAPEYAYPSYADYGYPYSYYSYPYYAYPYTYWWYNYSYPFAYYSPFYFGFGRHRFGDFGRFHRFDRFRDFNRFHNRGSFAFRGRPGFGGRTGPWAQATRGLGNRAVAGSVAGRSSFAVASGRPGGFSARPSGFSARSSGFSARPSGFSGRGGGGGFVGHGGGFSGGHFGGHGGGGFGGHGGGHR